MKVMIFDEEVLFSRGVAHVLNENFNDIEILQSSSEPEALRFLEEEVVLSLLIAGLQYPEFEIGPVIKVCRGARPELPILAVSATASAPVIDSLSEIGVRGCVSRTIHPVAIVHVIHLILAGYRFFSDLENVGKRRAREDHREDGVNQGNPSGFDFAQGELFRESDDSARETVNVTGRQFQVFQGLSEGKSNKQIARDLDISEGTVKVHVRRLMQKVGAKNRTQVAIVAARLKLRRTRDE